MRIRTGGAVAALTLAGLAGAIPAGAVVGPPDFAPYQAYPVGSHPESVVVADVNADGRSDVVLSNSFYFYAVNDFKLFVFLQQADGTLASPTRHDTDGAYGDAMSLAAGDLNGDGVTDVALATSAGVNVFHGGPAGLGPRTNLPVATARQVVVADLNRDNVNDVVVATGEGVVAFLGGIVGTLPVTVSSERQVEIEVGDVTGDGLLDVVGFTGATVHVWRFAAPNSFVAAGDHQAVVDYWPLGNGLAIGDLTGDGRNDVALSIGGNKPGSLLNVFEQTPAGTLAAPLAYPSYDIPEPVGIADMNGDGAADVVTLHGGWNRAGVYTQVAGDLLGERLYEIPYATHYSPKGLDVGDVNGDLRPDIVLADYNHGLVVLRGAAAPPPPPDITPPETTITAGPSGTVDTATATFSFSANEAGSTFACSMNGGVFGPCSSPQMYPASVTGRTRSGSGPPIRPGTWTRPPPPVRSRWRARATSPSPSRPRPTRSGPRPVLPTGLPSPTTALPPIPASL